MFPVLQAEQRSFGFSRCELDNIAVWRIGICTCGFPDKQMWEHLSNWSSSPRAPFKIASFVQNNYTRGHNQVHMMWGIKSSLNILKSWWLGVQGYAQPVLIKWSYKWLVWLSPLWHTASFSLLLFHQRTVIIPSYTVGLVNQQWTLSPWGKNEKQSPKLANKYFKRKNT